MTKWRGKKNPKILSCSLRFIGQVELLYKKWGPKKKKELGCVTGSVYSSASLKSPHKWKPWLLMYFAAWSGFLYRLWTCRPCHFWNPEPARISETRRSIGLLEVLSFCYIRHQMGFYGLVWDHNQHYNFVSKRKSTLCLKLQTNKSCTFGTAVYTNLKLLIISANQHIFFFYQGKYDNSPVSTTYQLTFFYYY